MAWGYREQLFLRACQAHSRGVAALVDMSRALEVFTPAHADWCPIGLHGTKLEYVQSITRGGLDTEHSVGGRLGEKRQH
eukprot:11328620-Alexandrium_andersonii.AAC.1